MLTFAIQERTFATIETSEVEHLHAVISLPLSGASLSATAGISNNPGPAAPLRAVFPNGEVQLWQHHVFLAR